MGTEDVGGFGLADVLQEVSRDLVEAQQRTTEEGGFGLTVGSVEIELAVAVTRETKAGGRAGLKLQVLPFFGSGEASVEAAHARGGSRTDRIKLVLYPSNQGAVGM
ncbi:trypco2 family protein [Streptomyces griseus]|uniref:trypco2 family protein n=1 Tax=Streptomyces griseus TaxID=1911 RepID=UPI0036CBFFF3